MKKILIITFLFFSFNYAFAQIVWVGVHGQTQFCPGNPESRDLYPHKKYSG